MSIFGIIGLTLFIAVIIAFLTLAIAAACNDWDVEIKHVVITALVLATVWIAGTFIGIHINTQDERVFAAKYSASKYTIEQSLDNPDLTGLERIQLVQQASDLNGQLAERKMRMNLWYYVYYDYSIYDNIEFIDLSK